MAQLSMQTKINNRYLNKLLHMWRHVDVNLKDTELSTIDSDVLRETASHLQEMQQAAENLRKSIQAELTIRHE